VKQKLTSAEKQLELDRYRAIIIATIEYQLKKVIGSIVFDNYDPNVDVYQHLQLQTEKYYELRKLDRLQKYFHNLTRGLQANLNFSSYIKDKTGYDIHLFEELKTRTDIVIAQKEIRNEKEYSDVSTMHHFYNQTSPNKEKAEILINLIKDFSRKTIINSTTKSVTISKQYSEITSPNGKSKIIVYNSGKGKNATTSVGVVIEFYSGTVFGRIGMNSDVKAYWKNDNTIVIETRKDFELRKDYIINTRYEQVQSYNDIIKIEYIEV
jgi:hypothetical protein